jgi:serine/threonine protein kinase/WD40 repeat protein
LTDAPGPDIFALFDCAAALEPAARAQFLRDSGADPQTQARVSAMLRADDSTLNLDATHAGIDILATLEKESQTEPALPTLRGHYRILRQIGQGGSGTVYEAEQTAPRRRVAIKAIRAGLASRRAVQRLRAEADILGRLQHPGIAQVIEAGLGEENQPDQAFIVMELIDGTPIHRYAADHRLGRGDRIALLLQVCEAVEHAHQRGVIHRDLKPANILVDRSGSVKVLDFGVARLLSTGDGPADTAEQGAVVGTLGFMSPEQAAGRTDAVDVRTDVYALGCLLYELLAGRPPVPVAGAAVPDALRLIQTHTPASLGSIDRSLRGDLSFIAARALEKDPDRRFPGVDALAEDLRRTLDGRPIRSRPRSASYIVARHARRHWVIAGLAVVLVGTLLAFSGKSIADASRFRRLAASESNARAVELAARRAAEHERARADAGNLALAAELAAADIERARLETRVGNGSAAEAVLWPAYARSPDSPAVLGALAELFDSHPCLWTASVPGATRVAGMDAAGGPAVAVGDHHGGVAFLDASDARPIGRLAPDADRSPVIALSASPPTGVRVVQRSGRLREVTLADRPAVTATRRIEPNPAAVALHPSGLLGAVYADGRMLLYHPGRHKPDRAWTVGDRPLTAVAISQDASLIAAAGTDRVIRVYETDSAEPRAELAGHEREVLVLHFDDQRAELRSMARDQAVRVWSLTTGEARIESSIQDHPHALAMTRDGAIILAESARIWLQAVPGGPMRSVAFPRTAFVHAAALPAAVVTAENGGEIRLWSTAKTPAISPLRAHGNWIFGIDVSPRHAQIVTSSADGTVRFTDLENARELGVFSLPSKVRARCVRFSPDQGVVAVGCSDGVVRLLDPADHTLIATLPGPGGEIYALAFSPDGAGLAAGAWDRAIRFWSFPDRVELGDLAGLESVPRGMAFSPTGDRLYASGAARAIMVIDPASRQVLDAIPTPAEPWSVAVSPDGRTLAAGLFDASVCFIDPVTGATAVGAGRHRLVVAGLGFSPDGHTLVSGGDDGTLRLWDTTASRPRSIRLADPGNGPIPIVRFTPEGRRVLAGTGTGVLITWDLHHHDASIARNTPSAAARYPQPPPG